MLFFPKETLQNFDCTEYLYDDIKQITVKVLAQMSYILLKTMEYKYLSIP